MLAPASVSSRKTQGCYLVVSPDPWPLSEGKQANQEWQGIGNESKQIHLSLLFHKRPLSFVIPLLLLSLSSCSAAHYLIKQKWHKNNLKNPSACQYLTPAKLRCHHKFWSLWFFYRQYGKRWAKWMREMVASNVWQRGVRKNINADLERGRQYVCRGVGGLKKDSKTAWEPIFQLRAY